MSAEGKPEEEGNISDIASFADTGSEVREVWAAENEQVVVDEYNVSLADGEVSPNSGLRSMDGGGGMGAPTPRLRHKIPPGESTTAFGTAVHWAKTWWNNRLIERNKNYGMDPYVRAKIGRHGRVEQTAPVISTSSDPPDVYINPQYYDGMDNVLTLTRKPGDLGELIIEVMDQGVDGREHFIGACHRHVNEFIKFAETSDEWQPVMFDISDHQLGENELLDDPADRDAGAVSSLVRWVPSVDKEGKWQVDPGRGHEAQGVLKVKIIACADLRDISALHISDIASFADTGSASSAFIFCVIYVLVFAGYYTHMMSWPFIDSVAFVITSFSTVGYGDHPSPLETTWERLVTTVFIITGMGVLGVTIGILVNYAKVKIDQQKRKVRERFVRDMKEKGDPDEEHKVRVKRMSFSVPTLHGIPLSRALCAWPRSRTQLTSAVGRACARTG